MLIDTDMTLAEKAEIVKSLATAMADGKVVEIHEADTGWERVESLHFYEDMEYRIRDFMDVNGFNVPVPETIAPIKGSAYYIPSVYTFEWYTVDFWQGTESNFRHLDRGILHLSKEGAVKHAKAMAGKDPSF
jgi:hypothetical protein